MLLSRNLLQHSFLFLSFGLALTSLSPASSQTALLEWTVLSGMEKLRPDQKAEGGRSSIELFAARGEAENLQVIVTAPQGGLTDVSLKASDLISSNGEKLSPELNTVGYVMIRQPTPDGYGEPGEYPDILYPNRPFNVAEGANQTVWYTVWTPLNAEPGFYEGTITISAKGKTPQTIPVKLRVYSAVVPKQSRLATAFGYGPWNSQKPAYYGNNWTNSELEEAFIVQMLRYRMTPVNSDIGGMVRTLKETFTRDAGGTWSADWARFDEEISNKLEQGWTRFHLSMLPLPWWQKDSERILHPQKNRWQDLPEAEQAQILQLLNAHLVEKGWAKYFAYKQFDEPSMIPPNMDSIRKMGEFLNQHAPDIRLLMVSTDCRERKLASDTPTYDWVPHLPSLHLDPGYEEFLKQRQKAGETAWTYICETRALHKVSYRYPDVAPPDRHGSSQRCFGVLAWRNRLDGFLYWNVNEWDYRGGYVSESNAHIGEGVLFYPDVEQKGLPFPSLRAALLRDGFEDHDLLCLLNEELEWFHQAKNVPVAHKETIAEAKHLLDVSHLMPNLRDFNRDSEAYETHHRAVLEALESLASIRANLP